MDHLKEGKQLTGRGLSSGARPGRAEKVSGRNQVQARRWVGSKTTPATACPWKWAWACLCSQRTRVGSGGGWGGFQDKQQVVCGAGQGQPFQIGCRGGTVLKDTGHLLRGPCVLFPFLWMWVPGEATFTFQSFLRFASCVQGSLPLKPRIILCK